MRDNFTKTIYSLIHLTLYFVNEDGKDETLRLLHVVLSLWAHVYVIGEQPNTKLDTDNFIILTFFISGLVHSAEALLLADRHNHN